ncbi:MAG: CvpA family protein [Peptococcaceae bacterium]|nr:CvpA family protein [Peptococcaceae bacterium]
MKAKSILFSLIITLIVGLLYFYFNLPAINLQEPAFYGFLFLLIVVYAAISLYLSGRFRTQVSNAKALGKLLLSVGLVPAIIAAGLALTYLVGSMISAPIFRATAYSELLAFDTGNFTDDVKEISFDQIPMLDADSTVRLGDRKLGELSDMVSQFEVSSNYSQINYKGRPVRVTCLQYGDIIKWFNNRAQGLPAYVIVDMVTQNAEVVRLSEGMKYSPSEPFFRNLSRHLRLQYPTFMFGNPVFEIDEEGIPYWVCPRIAKTIGLFGGTTIDGAVLLNAVTGESQYYLAEEVPSWIDRVYSADLILEQYDYYGKYNNGFFNSFLGQRDVTVTTEGYNYIAMNDDVYMYTGITSVGSDQSNVGFLLVNQRTKDATFYTIAGAKEQSAMHSAEGLVQDLRYSATFPLLLNIGGQPTYFMALKDQAGLVKMFAMVHVQYYQNAATGTTLADCERNYRALMQDNNLIEITETETPATTTVTGTLSEIRTAVIGGNSYYYLRLEEDSFYYVISAANCEGAVILNVEDQVEITGVDTEGDIRRATSVVKK